MVKAKSDQNAATTHYSFEALIGLIPLCCLTSNLIPASASIDTAITTSIEADARIRLSVKARQWARPNQGLGAVMRGGRNNG